ncbi:unnamed protein product, partial [Ectocarpus fasciculatus]
TLGREAAATQVPFSLRTLTREARQCGECPCLVCVSSGMHMAGAAVAACSLSRVAVYAPQRQQRLQQQTGDRRSDSRRLRPPQACAVQKASAHGPLTYYASLLR